MSELKKCPFCGKTVEFWRKNYDGEDWLTCKNCGESHLLKEWNNRPLEDAMQAERDLLQKKLDIATNMLQYFTKGWSDNVMANAIYALDEIAKLGEKK